MYFIMLAVSYVLLQADNPLRYVGIGNGVIQYMAAFVAGLFVFTFFGIGSGNTDYGGFGSITLLVLAQSVCVGLSEELIFRGAVPKALQISGFSYTSSRLIAAVAFSVFHGWAYNWSIIPLIASFFFGCLMQVVWDGGFSEPVVRRNGYPLAAVGLHAAWNVVAMSPFIIIAGAI